MTDIIQNPPQDAKQVEKYTNDIIEDNPNEQLEDNADSNADISFLDKIIETEDKDELFELINSQYNLIKQHIQNGEPFTEEIEQLRTALYKYEDKCDKPEHIQTLAEIMETYNLTHEVDNMSHNEDEFIGKIHSFFTKIKDKPEQKETYNKSRKKLDIMLNVYKNRYGENGLNENFSEILKAREEWDKLIAEQEEKKKQQAKADPKVLSHMAQKTMNAIENKQKLSENNWGEMTECAIKAAEAVGVTALVASNPLLGFIFVIIYILDANGVEPIHTVCNKYRETVNKKIIPFANELQKKYIASKNKEFDDALKYLEDYNKPMEFPKKEKKKEEKQKTETLNKNEQEIKPVINEQETSSEELKPLLTNEQIQQNEELGNKSTTKEIQNPTSPSTDQLPLPFADNENAKPVIIQPQNQPKQKNPKEQQESEPEPTTHLEREQQRRRLGNDLGLGEDIFVY